MEGSLRSGEVLKKKSSSGCLIIKKKSVTSNLVGLGGLSNRKEKKRPRLVVSDSGSSDEHQSLEFMRRKVNEKIFDNGLSGYREIEYEGMEYNRSDDWMESSGERKRNRVDLFEFDEYDEFEAKKMRNNYVEDRFKMVGRTGGGNFKEVGGGSSSRNVMVDKQKQVSYFDSSISGKNRGVEYYGRRSKGFELEEDEGKVPIPVLREVVDEPIRLQGKNGVLKVMVNKKKKMDFPSQHKNYEPREVNERKGSRSENVNNKDLLVRPSFCSVLKPRKQGLSVQKEKHAKTEKMELQLEKAKSSLSKSHKGRDSEVDEADTLLELAPPGQQAVTLIKGVKMGVEKTPPPENARPTKGKEEKSKRGGSTEKQMLREKIREMLVDAGWTIDYRPRRNRDYLDAVYINPSGTAYWSIIKAYEALKKQLKEDNGESKSDGGSSLFAPLSEDLLNKLTRQTKKKMKEEMKRKRKPDGTDKNKKSAVKEAAEGSDCDQNEESLSSYVKQNCKTLKGKLCEEDQEIEDDSSDDLPKRKPKKDKVEKSSNTANSKVIQGRTSKTIGRCTLLVRSSNKGQNSEPEGYVPYTGKRTVLGWLIDSGTAQLSEKVQYMNRRRTRVMLEGWITRDGIHCGCCSKILTVSKFELHAGSKLRQPFQNILLESGASLLQCQIDAWNKQEESIRQPFHIVDVDGDDPDDDTCAICGDGGDLVCCDSCPSTFHQSCLGIQMLPSGDWYCLNCTCKFCGDCSGNVAEVNDRTVDLIKCSLCEKKFHKSCSETVNGVPASSYGESHSFCEQKCQEIYDHLQKILAVKHELESGFSWSLIQGTDADSDTSHLGFPQRVECNSKLAVALSIMNECFLPIIDRRSGINIVCNAVYNCGSNFNRLNYSSFYTAILERGDEIISAASIRIRGNRLAEMPFIGTREINRRQGMCRRLLSAIESALSSLKVEKLIIPSISEHMSTWTEVFGFHQLEDVHKKEMKSMNMLVFPWTDMLQKQLLKEKNSDGMKVVKSTENQSQLPVLLEKSDIDSTTEDNRQVNGVAAVSHEIKIHDKDDAVGSGSLVSAVPSSDNTVDSASDATPETDIQLSSYGTTVIKSEMAKELDESSISLKCPSTDNASSDFSKMEKPLLDLPVKDNSQSSVDAFMGHACKISSEASCLESIRDSSGKNLNIEENAAKNEIPVSGSSICCNDECALQSKLGSDDDNVVQIQSKVGADSEVSLEAEVARVQGDVVGSSTVEVSDDAVPEISVKDGCIDSTPGSLFETSQQSTTEIVNGEQSSASFPAPGVGKEPFLQLNPAMDLPSALHMENELHSSVELSSDSVAAADAKVTPVEGNADSLAFRDINDGRACSEDNVEASGRELALGSSCGISARAATQEISDTPNPWSLSTSQASCENAKRFNTDVNQRAVLEVESKVALKVGQRKVVTVAQTDKSNGESKTNDPQELVGKVACANSSCESLVQNTASNENCAESG